MSRLRVLHRHLPAGSSLLLRCRSDSPGCGVNSRNSTRGRRHLVALHHVASTPALSWPSCSASPDQRAYRAIERAAAPEWPIPLSRSRLVCQRPFRTRSIADRPAGPSSAWPPGRPRPPFWPTSRLIRSGVRPQSVALRVPKTPSVLAAAISITAA